MSGSYEWVKAAAESMMDFLSQDEALTLIRRLERIPGGNASVRETLRRLRVQLAGV